MTGDYYIDEISELFKKKLSVSINHREFILYPKEISKFRIKEGEYLDNTTYLELIEHLSNRALKYAAYLLKARDYSVKMLEDKLALKKYPEECREFVIRYLIDKKYLDDKRFALNYCLSKQGQYGALRLKNELYQRGISSDIILAVLEEIKEEVNTRNLIEQYAQKRRFNVETADINEKNKFCRYLLRKGIEYQDIMDFLSNSKFC